MAAQYPTLFVLVSLEYRTHYDAGNQYLSRRSAVDQSAVPFWGGVTNSLIGASEAEPAGLAVDGAGRVIAEVNDPSAGLTVYYNDEGGEPGAWVEGA